MADFYRGKRVSLYRKQQQSGDDITLTISGPVNQEIGPASPTDRVRYMKNFRGMVTIYPGDTTPYNNFSSGYIGLVRYPRGEGYSTQNINIEASNFLHPVPFAMGGAPLSLLYDFKGITLGQSEVLYIVVQPTISFGNNSCVWQLIWAQRDEITP